MIAPRLLPAIPLARWAIHRVLGLMFTLLVAAPAFAGAAENAGRNADQSMVRIAFSKSLFAEINENDAKAAVKVYSQIIADENEVTTGGGPVFLDGTNSMGEVLRLDQVDVLSLTSEEFLALEDRGLVGPLLLTSVKQSFTEAYVLLAREESALRKVEDLKGRSLIVSSDVRASLVRIWLEVLCREHGLGPVGQALAKVTRAPKATQVVLPVFFGKADACIVTRSGFDVMGELNPQVKKQLRVVAVSPPVVPAMTCFRRGFPEKSRQRIIKAAEGSFTEPSFQQLMALFKTDSLGQQPVSVLESTRELMATYRRLCGPTSAADAGTKSLARTGKEGSAP